MYTYIHTHKYLYIHIKSQPPPLRPPADINRNPSQSHPNSTNPIISIPPTHSQTRPPAARLPANILRT